MTPGPREIAYGSPEYQAALALRYAVLVDPLGFGRGDLDWGDESSHAHFATIAPDGRAVAVLVLCETGDPERRRLRQMAVDPEKRGQGQGRALIELAERTMAGSGVAQIMLHARLPAVGFYRKMGYIEEGAEFIEVGIPHRLMHKSLAEKGARCS